MHKNMQQEQEYYPKIRVNHTLIKLANKSSIFIIPPVNLLA